MVRLSQPTIHGIVRGIIIYRSKGSEKNMKSLQFIWWVVNNKGLKNFDSYLSLSNRKRWRLWEEFNKLN